MPTARNRPTPLFICIGSQKSGTDWLYDQFNAHSGFRMPPQKEIHFFNRGFSPGARNTAWRKIRWMATEKWFDAERARDIRFLSEIIRPGEIDPTDLSHYTDMFGALTSGTDLHTADICPGYFPIAHDLKRHIAAGLPRTRIVALLRDPVERLWSQVLMHQRWQGNPLWDKRAVLSQEAAETAKGIHWFMSHDGVMKLSRVARQIRVWREAFGERFEVFFFDDLRKDPEAFRASICSFLGVDPGAFSIDPGHNKKANQKGKREISPPAELAARRILNAEYRNLARDLGGTAAQWLERHEARLAELEATV